MEKNAQWKPYVLLSLIVPAVIVSGLFLLLDIGFFGLVLSLGLLYSIFPIMMMGLYMWASGSGYRWVNGVDWTKLSETGRIQGSRTMGLSLFVTAVLMLAGLAALFAFISDADSGFAIGMTAFAILMAAGIGVAIYGTVKVSRKDFDAKWKYQTPKAPSKNSVLALIAASIILTVPAAVMISDIGGGGGGISVTLGDDSFTVEGPMFDHTFEYSDIESLYLDEDFDKGRREMGYGTPSISSGRYQNDEFKGYNLASYAKVKPCIVILAGGEYCAFNQSSEETTNLLFEELKSKISV